MFFRRLAVTAALVLLPATALGATVSETLRTPDSEAVTRGDFIRSAVTVLGLSASEEGDLGFKRPVPKNLQPYVRAAKEKGALSVFGSDLALTKSMTRGEAVQVLVKLSGLSAKGKMASYTDIKKGSDLEKAVNIAVSAGWIKPLRTNSFGAGVTMKGGDVRLLLRNVVGEKSGPSDSPRMKVKVKINLPTEPPKGDVLKNVWQLLNKDYLYHDRIDPEKAGLDSVEAVVNSVNDPYTTFMPPSESKNFQDTLHGEVVGIGAQVEIVGGILTVTTPLKDSPAEKAGVKPGDQILKVDGAVITGLSLTDAVSKIRGAAGTSVTLTISRNDAQFDVTITRATVFLPEITLTEQGDTTIIRIMQFGDQTRNKVRALLTDVGQDPPKGLILDLRNNPGGYLEVAGEVLSAFFPKGSAYVHIKTRKQEYDDLTQKDQLIPTDIPMYVLVNEGSASASEIVAGALQDAKRAKVLGQKSFGKGTVQEVLQFTDGSSLKMTIAEWFTPMQNKINGVGVIPDIQVQNTGDRDEQLLKALELLR